MDNQQTIQIMEAVSKCISDGHFTIMRFTTNWRVSFGFQPQSWEDIQEMPAGESLFDAFINALEKEPTRK